MTVRRSPSNLAASMRAWLRGVLEDVRTKMHVTSPADAFLLKQFCAIRAMLGDPRYEGLTPSIRLLRDRFAGNQHESKADEEGSDKGQ
jgi:hypothetical protein